MTFGGVKINKMSMCEKKRLIVRGPINIQVSLRDIREIPDVDLSFICGNFIPAAADHHNKLSYYYAN